jgi:hypothetical protein
MGTSKGYGGSKTGLVPSWVDDVAPSVVPTAPPTPQAPGAPTSPTPVAPTTPSQPAAVPGTLGAARSSFTRFARTGSQSSLGGALSGYIRKGTGGARNAAHRMAASRRAGAKLLGVFRDVQQYGAAEALRRLNLSELAGRPAADVFVALVEFACPPGGALDEAIARQSMLEVIGDLAEAGVTDFDALTPAQLREFFLDFLARSIEGRVMADLAQRGIAIPDDVADVERMQQQLHDFVSGCTRGQLSARLDGVEQLGDDGIERVVDEIYEAAFELVAASGEAVA